MKQTILRLASCFLPLASTLLLPASAFSQTDSSKSLQEVVISGFKPGNPKFTSLNIESYSLKEINEKTPYNLSDALAKLPGISQMTTGNSISKPVIRGLYGNRVLVLLSGLRFDNQQWQDEHGLGLSQIGIDRVEVIKGPASLLYGSDALGGVINVVEEKPTEKGIKLDAGTQLFSNSMGTLTDVGLSRKGDKAWFRLRGGFENHADYSDGNNTRVLNSRNNGYYAKVGFGFDNPKWKQENSYNYSYNQYGFILEGLNDFFTADERWNRSMNGPHHIVTLHLFNSQNTFYLKNSLLKLNAGFQSNNRQEDEGGGQISLHMQLTSGLENLRWEKDLSKKVSLVINQQFTYENNTNYGGRVIIPDANMMEGNLSGYLKFFLHKIIIETGIGGHYKSIETFQTKTINAPGELIQPFIKNDLTGNGMLGAAFNPSKGFTIKANASTGFRSPNLAELSSNGLHEGVYRYEVGDPDLKTEQNLNSDLSFELDKEQFFLSISGFYNRFLNYVYLAPSDDEFYSYPVFYFQQQDATLTGAELALIDRPGFVKWLQLKESFSMTQGKLDNGDNLPFIPAFRINSALRFEKALSKRITSFYLEPEFVYTFHQNNPAQFETETDAYSLLNVTAGIVVFSKKGNLHASVTANNITNTVYADHLSRLKYYGLYNQGFNFVFSVRKEIKW